MFAVSSVRSLSNFWNQAKWDFLMQKRSNSVSTMGLWQILVTWLWPNVYFWWTDIYWTTSWLVADILLANCSKQISRFTNILAHKWCANQNIWVGQNICWWTKISLKLLQHHTCLALLLCIILGKSGLYWATPGKMFRHGVGMAGFPQQRIE